jgi:hypothetical protein
MYRIYSKNDYVTQKDGTEVYWLNGVIPSYVKEGDKEDFLNFISEIEENPAIEEVGYTKQGSAIVEYKLYSIPLFDINEAYSAWTYRLSEGQWFDFQKNETQFILSGDARKSYRVGESITVQIPIEDENQKMVYQSYSGIVIGFLQEPAYMVDLNYAASSPDFSNMLTQYRSLILTNDETLIDSQEWSCPEMSLLVKVDRQRQKEAEAVLDGYGVNVSFSEIQQNSREEFWTEFWQMLFPNITMMIAVIYGVAGTTYLVVYQSRRALAIYEMCGQTPADRRVLILFVNGCPMVLGVVLSFVLSCIKGIKDSLNIENVFTVYRVLSSAALLLIFVIVMCLCAHGMLRATTIANMKKGVD